MLKTKRVEDLPLEPIREAYIRFMASVVPHTAEALMKAIDTKIAAGVERLHLLISCRGGSVFHGLSIYNFLRGAPIEVFTYNFGSVDSIGVVIFCSGSKRISVPHARFMIHGVTASLNAGTSLDERELEEVLKGIKIDYENIARVISDTTGQNIAKVMDDMNDRTTLSPHEAVAYGLVHEETSALFPPGADLYVVGEHEAVQLAYGPSDGGPKVELGVDNRVARAAPRARVKPRRR